MRSRILLLSLSAALLAGYSAPAQLLPADDFFHGGAMAYLSNNIPVALERVTNGLAVYPNDEKLKKLYELLKQQQQSQSQSQQSQQQQQQQDQQSKQDQQKKQQDQKQEQQPKQDQQKQQPDQKQSEKDKEQQQTEEKQQQAGEMNPEEAKQLLDSQKNDEALLPISRSEKHRDDSKPIKDW